MTLSEIKQAHQNKKGIVLITPVELTGHQVDQFNNLMKKVGVTSELLHVEQTTDARGSYVTCYIADDKHDCFTADLIQFVEECLNVTPFDIMNGDRRTMVFKLQFGNFIKSGHFHIDALSHFLMNN